MFIGVVISGFLARGYLTCHAISACGKITYGVVFVKDRPSRLFRGAAGSGPAFPGVGLGRKIAVGMLGLALADCAELRRCCQLQPRVGSPSAWSRCLRSTTRSIGAPAIRRSCKRHCLIPRTRTGLANLFRRTGQRGRRRDRRLRARRGSRICIVHRSCGPCVRSGLRRPCVALESAASQCRWTARWRRHAGPRRGSPGGSSTNRPAGTDCAFTAARDGRP